MQVVGQGDGVKDVSIIHAPFSLAPTPFPQSEFELVQRSMPLFCALAHAVSQDTNYLRSTLAAAAQYDEFTRNLLDVWEATVDARKQHGANVSLGLLRSDYMLDEPSASLLQVHVSMGEMRVALLRRTLVNYHSLSCKLQSERPGDMQGGGLQNCASVCGQTGILLMPACTLLAGAVAALS